MNKYNVCVVEDEMRLVWQSPDYDNYDVALDVFKDECKKSGYEVLLSEFKDDEWHILKDRPQRY